tara:strand:+ start:579 stop:704 length:126 start_codon:yes stop_codon:yes gene_type:complete
MQPFLESNIKYQISITRNIIRGKNKEKRTKERRKDKSKRKG